MGTGTYFLSAMVHQEPLFLQLALSIFQMGGVPVSCYLVYGYIRALVFGFSVYILRRAGHVFLFFRHMVEQE